jgi:hypothetical protein
MLTAADVALCGTFAGSWLLVAGPIFQGALELRSEDFDRAALHEIKRSVPMPDPISPWWWLLPPVLYFIHARNTSRYRARMFAAMTLEQRQKTIGYINKANGWFMVAGGGALLAVKETWSILEHYSLPWWVMMPAVSFMMTLCTFNTIARLLRANRVIKNV